MERRRGIERMDVNDSCDGYILECDGDGHLVEWSNPA